MAISLVIAMNTVNGSHCGGGGAAIVDHNQFFILNFHSVVEVTDCYV